MKGKPRVWVLITQQAGFALNETVLYRYYLDTMGRRLMSFEPDRTESGHAYLYDLSVPPDPNLIPGTLK